MNTTIERKCNHCGNWNQKSDYCSFCNTPISIEVLEKIEYKKKQKIEAEKPSDKLDIWIEKLKNHPFIPLRILFYSFYSIWLILMGIGSFLAWLIAWAAG